MNFNRILLIGLLLFMPFRARTGHQVNVVFLPEIRRIEIVHATHVPGSDRGSNSIVIPLKRAGKLFLIEAMVDGISGNFVFDTGADKMVLNKNYFRNGILTSEGPGGGITGNSQTIYVTQVKKITASGLEIENQTVDVTELGNIENRRKIKVLGLIGMSLFSGMEMEIDLRHASLKLYLPDRTGVSVEQNISKDTSDYKGKIFLVRKLMFLKGLIGGRSFDFCLDTGAESNVISSLAPKKVLETITIASRSQLSGMGGGDTEVLFGTMNDFALGEKKFNPMQTIIANLDALSQAYDYPVTGILGFDFFDQGVICVNLVTKEIRISFHGKE